jgi:uncharacterized membrane protein YkoI
MNRAILIAALPLLAIETTSAAIVSQPAEAEFDWTPYAIAQESDEREPGPADLEEAIEIAVERYGGRATNAETVERDGQLVHEIRLFGEDGSVRTVRIDPETGAIIPQRRR